MKLMKILLFLGVILLISGIMIGKVARKNLAQVGATNPFPIFRDGQYYFEGRGDILIEVSKNQFWYQLVLSVPTFLFSIIGGLLIFVFWVQLFFFLVKRTVRSDDS